MNLPLIVKKNEARVDSRLLAGAFGRQHRAQLALVDKHLARFEKFGKVFFEKAPSIESATGQRERFALLNEDQCYLLLTFTRNTPQVADLKVKLVQAFSEARKAAELHQEYLPTYHAMHDQLTRLHDGTEKDRLLHMNINKLVNKAAHVEAGQRGKAPIPQQAMMIAVQHIASMAVQGATDHRDGYAKAKEALAPFLPHKLLEG